MVKHHPRSAQKCFSAVWASTPQCAAVASACVCGPVLMESVSNRAVKQKTSEGIKMQAAVDRPQGDPGGDYCSVYLFLSTAQLDEYDAD